jgi:hypothetical protein
VIDLAAPERIRLLADVESILRNRFADGKISVPYQSRIWMAQLT